MASIVQAVNLGKQVQSGGQPLLILQDVNFNVEPGESLAILGASGSGKSTLLGLLAGLDVPTHGTVMLDGNNLFEFDEDQRARLRGKLAGFVFQSFQLLPALSALENVMLPLELQALPGARERATAALQQVGLSQRMTHLPKHLSGGEQQRVALARGCIQIPGGFIGKQDFGLGDKGTG